MSKILDAVKRAQGEGGGDYRYNLATVEGARLYPPPSDQQIREFEQLANSILNLHRGQHGEVITFASTSSGEGSSYVSYNMARHLSFMLGRKICWVDANFIRPQRKAFEAGIDFRSLLKEPGRFSELKSGANLCLVPNGDSLIRSTDLLSSENYLRLIEEFRRTFYFTIIDAPPILDSVDVARLAAPTIGLALVVQSRRLKHEVVKHAIEQMRQHQVTVLGTVLNRRTFDIPAFLYDKI